VSEQARPSAGAPIRASFVGDRSCHIATNLVCARDGAGEARTRVQGGREPPAFASAKLAGAQRRRLQRTSSVDDERERVVPRRTSAILGDGVERGS
jgi:hypothetical protein